MTSIPRSDPRFTRLEATLVENEWLTTNEAALYLKLHCETLRRWARRGVAPSVKFGNRGGFRFKREELDRFMEERTRRP